LAGELAPLLKPGGTDVRTTAAQRLLRLVVAFAALAAIALSLNDRAMAAEEEVVVDPAYLLDVNNFCGRLVPSNRGFGTPCDSYAKNRWTYASNTYKGGGNIDRMRVWMNHSGTNAAVGIFDWYFFVDNGTFINGCWYGNFTHDYPSINQFEGTEASHTLYGRADDSNGHSNCKPEYLV
jgi:hypothetical protein